MSGIVKGILDGVDTVLAWVGGALKQTADSYCDIETADSPTVLVSTDGSLVSVLRVNGATALMGAPEFERLHAGLVNSLQTAMSRPGQSIQVHFNYDRDEVRREIHNMLTPARETADVLDLDLHDLFEEKLSFVSRYCAQESVFFVLWTRPQIMTKEQFNRTAKDKQQLVRTKKIPPLINAQNFIAAIPDLRDAHDSFVRSLLNDLNTLNVATRLLSSHEAVYEIRRSVDPEFTDVNWQPVLPGDKIPVRMASKVKGDISDIVWPPLSRQILPRDSENIDLRTVRVGDRIYSTLFMYLFPKEIRQFIQLFRRTLPTQIPWRMSFLIDSDGISTFGFKTTLASILSFSSSENRLLNDAVALVKYLKTNTDSAIVRLRVSLATWAPEGDIRLLRTRTAQLAKALEGWGSAEISEISGDPFEGVVSTMMGVSGKSVATPTVLPLHDAVFMLPITRPSSPWEKGVLLFRTPDGKPWPFQPGSSQQTTWIELVYARPGSGKSVLSNAINLALCLSGGINRLPRIAIIDIGPSSSGLISLLKEALPQDKRHLVAYHRLRMTPDYAINPFDTQLGCRFPTAQDRAFLVNFLSLLATQLGDERAYDGIADMAGMVVDELYKTWADSGNPVKYTPDLEPLVDGIISEIGFVKDLNTTWWEITDALFVAGFQHEAMLAQRYAMPLLADAAAIVRSPSIEDLYGAIIAPTGETLINAFSRMISGAVREYPILSRVTNFDIGEGRVVSLDLDEVAKSGGEAADRQTAVMYMLARYTLARNYYLTDGMVNEVPEIYQSFHRARILEIREDPKRIVYDEFHRTAKSSAVRDQVIIDMREGRKWNIQIGLLSQSLDDFDSVMVEFATSIYIMDAGPAQAIKRSAETFGLSETAQVALRTRVHGPREGGATFLAQYATKNGVNLQLLTLTLGPIELWSFSTTAQDAHLRNQLYKRLGPVETRRVLARLFPSGSATKLIEQRLMIVREESGVIEDVSDASVVDELVEEILQEYARDPEFKSLTR